MMIGRDIPLALVLALAVAAPSAAQTADGRCAGQDAVGFIGISGIECNCTIGSPDPDQWAFRTEPRITLRPRGGLPMRVLSRQPS